MVRALIGGCLVMTLAGLSAGRLAALRPTLEDATELRLYPSGRLVECLTLGQRTLLADIAWLQAIQYYGKHRMADRRYPLADHLFDVITRVDPQFRSAYVFGALVLEEETRALERSRTLFARGMRANPDDWMIAFQRGFLEYLRGDAATGSLQMVWAARLPGAPPYVARLAAHACGKTGRREMAIRIWQEIALHSEDPAIQALALQRLRDLRREDVGSPSQEGLR